MKKLFTSVINWIDTAKYKLLILTVIIFIFISVFAFALFEYWSSPGFCNTCHIMEPYYDSWKHSTHNKVSCVECHYEPGTLNVLKGKWLAIKELAAFVTGSHKPKPQAEISDNSCLRSGCHSRRILEGKVKFSEREISFDHKPHLSEIKHGIKLSCTSCHSQLVIGSHILVTQSSCFLCHFKGGTKRGLKDNPLGGCGICHGAPEKVITRGGYSIDHKEFIKSGMECTRCHIDLTSGDGKATKDKCFNCHNQAEKLDKFGETEFIHMNHVAIHKVDCERCHEKIEHKFNSKTVETQYQNCQSCHEQTHSVQAVIYSGKGAKGLSGKPDPMYVAGISCSGCHVLPKNDEEIAKIKGQTFISGETPCVTCHEDKYTRFVGTFKNNLSEMISYLEQKTRQLEPKIEAIKDANTKKLFNDAEYNLKFVSNAKGVHNPFYCVDILRACDSNLSQVENAVEASEEKLARPKTFDNDSCLLLCHGSMKMPTTIKIDKETDFPHGKHAKGDTPACTDCHQGEAHPSRANMNKKSCSVCH